MRIVITAAAKATAELVCISIGCMYEVSINSVSKVTEFIYA